MTGETGLILHDFDVQIMVEGYLPSGRLELKCFHTACRGGNDDFFIV